VIPVGAKKAVPHASAFIEDDASAIPDALRPVFAELCHEIRALGERSAGTERQLEAVAKQSPAAARLQTIPGVGLLVAADVLAFIGDIQRFPSGRHFASYLGLTPRESSSGLRRSSARHQARRLLSTDDADSRGTRSARFMPIGKRTWIGFVTGPCGLSGTSAANARPSRSRTRWPASSGRS
jgi:transposase